MNNKVIILGTGNAALSAAISAIDQGAQVEIFEKATRTTNGGNSRITAGLLRLAFDHPDQIREVLHKSYTDEEWNEIEIIPYTQEKYAKEVITAGKGRPDKELVDWFSSESLETVRWLRNHGVKFELADYLTPFALTGKRRYADGVVIQSVNEGEGLIKDQINFIEMHGGQFHYNCAGTDLIMEDGKVKGVVIRNERGQREEYYGAVILGCGGFEASSAMRTKYLGPEWDVLHERCVSYNTGEMTEAAIRHGAGTAGHWSGAHITPIDIDSPWKGGLDTREFTNRLGFCWGITLNKSGHRFVNEGRYWTNQIYVEIGKAILKQDDCIGYQLFDERGMQFAESNYKDQKQMYKADTLAELAEKCPLPAKEFLSTVEAYNNSCRHNTQMYDPSKLDGQTTKGLEVEKTNWALPIEEGPFYLYPVVPGVTFTFGGLKSNTNAQITDDMGYPIPGLYGVGEVTGGFFYYAYPTGSGLVKGMVTGRAAGRHAAIWLRENKY